MMLCGDDEKGAAAAATQRIMVTGGNKGIGLAICEAILNKSANTHVLLGSRSKERGEAAVAATEKKIASAKGRIELVVIDVSSEDSVKAAAASVKAKYGEGSLYGLVNNAGIGAGEIPAVLQVNLYGTKYTCEHFMPLIQPDGGRITLVNSGAGPGFVRNCSEERQKQMINPKTTWDEIEKLANLYISTAAEGGRPALCKIGLENPKLNKKPDDLSPYGLSKALGNMYVMVLAAQYPKLVCNSCSPGFINTDMVAGLATRMGTTPEKMGALPVERGALSTMTLLFGDVGTGMYYGSDSKRSPMHRKRDPGDPEYLGEE